MCHLTTIKEQLIRVLDQNYLKLGITVQKDDKVNFFLLKPLKYPYLNVGVFFNSRECRFEKVDLLFDALVTVDDNPVLVGLANNNVVIFD